jgi:hypothetical protein
MSSCPPNTLQCQTVQLIEPDFTLPTVTLPPPGNDPSLAEAGSIPLTTGQGVVNVPFTVPKAGDYRFEYLYVDDLGTTSNPGVISLVPVSQTLYGFTVDISGVPVVDGYILRWRVVVIAISGTPTVVDAPENLYVLMPYEVPDVIYPHYSMVIPFVNPRSNTTYGFSELRVENLIDNPSTMPFINIIVTAKNLDNFVIGASPFPPNGSHFYVVARTP